MTLCGSCWAHFQPAFDKISFQPELRRLNFHSFFYRKCVSCVFRCHSRAESLLLQVPASKSEQVATKSHPETVSRSRSSPAEQYFEGSRFRSPAQPLSKPSRPSPADPAQPEGLRGLSGLELSGEPTSRYRCSVYSTTYSALAPSSPMLILFLFL